MYITLFLMSQEALFKNNRAESLGNVQSLQYTQTAEGQRSLLTGQSIRRAIRSQMQEINPEGLYRHNDACDTNSGYGYGPNRVPAMKDAKPDIDKEDDALLFGYMITGQKGTAVEETIKRRSPVFVADAISSDLWDGDQGFGQGLSSDSGSLMPTKAHQHYTSYGVLITVNLGEVAVRPAATERMFRAIASGLRVGGNHAAHASELTPAYLVWRLHRTSPSVIGALNGKGLSYADAVTFLKAQYFEPQHVVGQDFYHAEFGAGWPQLFATLKDGFDQVPK